MYMFKLPKRTKIGKKTLSTYNFLSVNTPFGQPIKLTIYLYHHTTLPKIFFPVLADL